MSEAAGSGGASTSNNVYVKDEDYAWLPARLISQTGDKAVVSVAQYKDEASIASDGGKAAKGWKEKKVNLRDYPNKTLPLQNVDKGGDLIPKEDMVDLPFLHEAAILYNVKARHCLALPYTRTGDIVIAVNPYQWLTHLYTDKARLEYAFKLVWDKVDGDPRRKVRPHVYEISSLCYKGLALDGVNQSILVSGESGAGKTETVKICMNHIASVQRGPVTDDAEYSSIVVQRVLDSNPLLEAFGNAKTRRNDNSSRFGKYINLQFSRKERILGMEFERCELAGSKCDVYLLEKSRVVSHEDIEGTYHIFYQLLGATDNMKGLIWDGLKGSDYDSYKFVGKPPYERKIEGMTDAENYEATVKSLALIHVRDENLLTLMRSIVITLALGNIVFGKDPKDDERSVINTRSDFDKVQQLIGIDAKTLELSFTERTVKTRTDIFKVPLKANVAKESCNAFAKEVYAKTFLWLVREINSATTAEENYEGGGQTEFMTIGLLDIFGFESFPVNGFEQLCINYANEKLQQKFTRDIFESVQIEYEAEGIDLNTIHYDDNSDVLELIEGRTGLIKMLNEECVRPKGNDGAFVNKAYVNNKKSEAFISGRQYGPMEFGIHHYAGKVVYNADGFVTSNNDTLPMDLHEAAKMSSNEIISKHLDNDKMMKSDMKVEEKPSTGRSAPKRGKSNLTADTIWTKFKSQLNSLMTGLNSTNSRYIRCLKPNSLKKPLVMQHMTTVEQLRCAGVVAAVTISRSAFPNRLGHRECVERFKVMKLKGSKLFENEDDAQQVIKLLDPVLKCREKDGEKAYVMGLTRVYFRGGALELLEQERSKHWEKWVIEVQRFVRGWLVRRRNWERKLAAAGPQATTIQCMYRKWAAKKEAKRRKKKHKMRRKMEKMKVGCAVKIQSVARMYIQKAKFETMIGSKRERDKLKKKIKEMEQKIRDAQQRRLKETEDAKEAAEKEIEEYKSMVREEKRKDKAKKTEAAKIGALLSETQKIIDFQKKENDKLRSQYDSMKKDYKSLKETNDRLTEANESASKTFQSLNDQAKQMNLTNSKLLGNVEQYKVDLEKLKSDLASRQEYYLAEAEIRLSYQKIMASVVTAIQDKVRDPGMVEEVVIMALECEASAKSERAALDVMGQKKDESDSDMSDSDSDSD